MKMYIYIMSKEPRGFMHVGFTRDILKTVKFYNELPTIGTDNINKIYYMADVANEASGQHHLKHISGLTRAGKIEIVESFNPDWHQLLPGVNIQI